MSIDFRDVSHHDYDRGDRTLAGQPLVICKATEGTTFRDPRYNYWRTDAAHNRVPFAAYHYLRNSNITDQARHAFDVVGPTTPLMIDAEVTGSTVPRILDFARVYRQIGGTVTLVYLPRWWWSGHIGRPDLRPLQRAGLALISSQYTAYSDDGPGWEPYGGVTPSIWQYTSTPHDRNRFRGSLGELLHLVFGDLYEKEDDVNLDDQVSFTEGMKQDLKKYFPADKGIADGSVTARTALGSGYGHGRIGRLLAARALDEAQATRAELAALRDVIGQLADALTAGGGSVDTQAVLAGIDQRIATLKADLAKAAQAEAAALTD